VTVAQPHGWLDGLQEAVWLVDEVSLLILHANAAAERLSGFSLADMAGKSVLSLAATPQDQAFWAEPADIVADGIHSHTCLLRADGVLLAVDRKVTRVRQEVAEGAGRSVFMLTMLDRSTQVATERELEKLLSELRATLDSVADGMLVCDLDGHVRAFNQRLAQLWAMPRDLLLRRDDAAVYAHMAAQVEDARAFSERLAAIAQAPTQESADIVVLRNGTVLELRTVPQVEPALGRTGVRVQPGRHLHCRQPAPHSPDEPGLRALGGAVGQVVRRARCSVVVRWRV
jgi:PAS domain-containing protein